MKKNLLLIINPNSGKGNVKKKIKKLIQNFEKLDYVINKVYTEKGVSIKDKVEKYLNETDLIVCCGGDGTLNETINMIVNLDIHKPLTFVPLGTMNDFSKILGISKKTLFSVRKDKDLKLINSDVGEFNGRYFNYVAAFGAFSEVSYETPQRLKNLLGKLAYFMIAAKYITRIKPYDVKIEYDGKVEEGQFIYGAISNSRSIGGFKWYKKVDLKLDDGKFEMLFVRKPRGPIKFINTLILLLRRKYKEPYFIYAQTGNVKITTKEDVKWTLDGEGMDGTKEVAIKNINKRVTYAIPHNKPKNK